LTFRGCRPLLAIPGTATLGRPWPSAAPCHPWHRDTWPSMAFGTREAVLAADSISNLAKRFTAIPGNWQLCSSILDL